MMDAYELFDDEGKIEVGGSLLCQIDAAITGCYSDTFADDFAEFRQTYCSKMCLVVLEAFCTVSTLLNIVVFLAFFRREKSLARVSSRQVFMFALILNDVLRTTVAVHSNWWTVWMFPSSDNVWLCRIHFLLSETCIMCSLLFPALYAIHECCTRGFPTSPLTAYLSQHKSSQLVDVSILMIGLCSPVIFVVGQTHFSHYNCVFMYYNSAQTGFATAYVISYRVRLGLKALSLLSMWISTIVLALKVSDAGPSSRTRLQRLWVNHKLLIVLLLKATFLASPYGVFIPLLWKKSPPTMLVGEILALAQMFDYMLNAPLFLWTFEGLRFWTSWTLPECLKTCRHRTSCQQPDTEQNSV